MINRYEDIYYKYINPPPSRKVWKNIHQLLGSGFLRVVVLEIGMEKEGYAEMNNFSYSFVSCITMSMLACLHTQSL